MALLWTEDEELILFGTDSDERPQGDFCTPEKLADWIKEIGRMPTLNECKKRFGGILSAMVSAWELDRRGEWPPTLR